MGTPKNMPPTPQRPPPTKMATITSGFVRGKLLDSLIIGILCFIFSSFFEFPYAPAEDIAVKLL